MTAKALIELLKQLPPDTFISIFDPANGERIMLDPQDPIDNWDEKHADLNLIATTIEQ